MSRITKILSNVRIDLGDTDATRYTDDILIRHLNTAIKEFTLATKCLRSTIYMGLSTSATIYDLRPYVLEFIRIEYLDKNIEAKSYVELDKINPDWQSATGTEVEYVTFDHLSKGMLRVYPKVTGAIDMIDQNSLYGGLIDITLGDEDFQIPSLSSVEENLDQYLVCRVVKKHAVVTINTLDTEFEIDEIYDNALEAYVMFKCLRSDTDVNNRAYGNEQLQIYANYVAECKENLAVDNNIVHDRVIMYRGAFE